MGLCYVIEYYLNPIQKQHEPGVFDNNDSFKDHQLMIENGKKTYRANIRILKIESRKTAM